MIEQLTKHKRLSKLGVSRYRQKEDSDVSRITVEFGLDS